MYNLFIWGLFNNTVSILDYVASSGMLTNCNWEKITNGADSCCLLLINHKQTPTHEPQCSSWHIIPSTGSQINYFPSFQTLWAIRHADSAAKFVWTSQQETHRSTKLKKKKNSPYTTDFYLLLFHN
jgi:hypothetical protein